ncbi:MAG: hypothetical protein IJ776_00065 [Paludibacteraceae bacterium]|nr:hypothetical protein [Paludibacteraceae bacterium]
MNNNRLFLILLFAAFSLNIDADIYVYQLVGESFLVKDKEETILYKTQQLQPTDLVRTAEYASLTLLDDKRKKLFTVQTTEPMKVEDIISRPERTVSLLEEAFYGIFQSMRKDNQKSVAHYQQQAGVTYRGDNEDMAVAMALTAKSSTLTALSNQQTDYPVLLRLLDLQTLQPVSTASVGMHLIAEVENRSNTVLYVNLIDIDTEGNTSILFPMDEQSSMLHLIVPAYSVIRFTDYPFTIYGPTGTDRFVLVAFNKPYNLKHALELMPLQGNNTEKIGFYTTPLQIMP